MQTNLSIKSRYVDAEPNQSAEFSTPYEQEVDEIIEVPVLQLEKKVVEVPEIRVEKKFVDKVTVIYGEKFQEVEKIVIKDKIIEVKIIKEIYIYLCSGCSCNSIGRVLYRVTSLTRVMSVFWKQVPRIIKREKIIEVPKIEYKEVRLS